MEDEDAALAEMKWNEFASDNPIVAPAAMVVFCKKARRSIPFVVRFSSFCSFELFFIILCPLLLSSFRSIHSPGFI
jgi:hypothetical protein